MDASAGIARHKAAMILVAAAAGVAWGILCRAVAGVELGLFFGAFGGATLLAPALALCETPKRNRALVTLTLVCGLAAVSIGTVPWIGWVQSVVVLLAYTAALVALASALSRIGLPGPAAAGLAVIAGLAWLSWPVWMAPWLRGEMREQTVALLVAPHPLLTINGVLSGSFPVPWSQHMIAYYLTNIGDDIPYRLPTNILAAVAVHGGVAAGLAFVAFRKAKGPASEATTPPPSRSPTHPPVDR